jgi:hypothetical protein
MTEPAQIALRRERRLAELGTRTPICVCCGETALECLELHHVVGKKLDSTLMEIRCRNCHRKIEYQRDVLGLTGNGIRTAPVLAKAEISRLRLLGLAESYESTAQALRRWAKDFEPSPTGPVLLNSKEK